MLLKEKRLEQRVESLEMNPVTESYLLNKLWTSKK